MARWTMTNVSSRGSDSITLSDGTTAAGVQIVADIAYDGVPKGNVECVLWKDAATGWIAREVKLNPGSQRPELIDAGGVRAKWSNLNPVQSDTTQFGDVVLPGFTVQGDLSLDNVLQGTFKLVIVMTPSGQLAESAGFTGPFAPHF